MQDVFRTLYEKGYIVEQTAIGAFSAATGRTLPDRTSRARARTAGSEAARGDQCDNCGNQLDPTDLIEPRSKIDGTTPVFKETEHLFLDLPAFNEQLNEWIERARALALERAELLARAAQGARPRPITRDLDWGVPIPVPEGYEESEDKRIYVWFDAVIGYLSAAIEWAANRGTPDAWRDWWQNPERGTTTSWARTTSSSTASSGRAAARLRGGRRSRRRPRLARAAL